MGLRKGQKELVELYRSGHCGIPAIPGGGKTYCLTQWATEIISQGLHKPGKILIVTYMISAVNNFKQRISGELVKRGIISNRDYTVSTIHGLCLQILKERPDVVMLNEDFNVIDGVEQNRILKAAISEWKKHSPNLYLYYLDTDRLNANKLNDIYKRWDDTLCKIFLTCISDFKCRGLNPLQALEMCKELDNTSLLKQSAYIYDYYDRRVKSLGLIDFNDMLYKALTLLKTDNNLLAKYQDTYTFVCEDEAQDSNNIQSEILELISGKTKNLLRVGDSNQSILGTFTNADYTLFRDFCEKPDTTIYNIFQSSRSSRDILELANRFVKYVRNEHPQPECRESLLEQYIEPVSKDDEKPNPKTSDYGIRATVFDKQEEEIKEISEKCKELVKQYPDKTIAILCPSAYSIQEYERELKYRKVPYESLQNTSGECNKTVKALGYILDFVSLPQDNEKFSKMLEFVYLDKEYENKEIFYDFIKSSTTENLIYPVGDEIGQNRVPQELVGTPIWKDFIKTLPLIKEILEFPPTVIEKLILFIAEKLKFNKEERAIAQKIAQDTRFLLNQENSWKLCDLATELLSPNNIFNFFASIVWDLKGYEAKPGVVTLCTYHKSKGLEWDILFLSSVNSSEFPVSLKDKFKGDCYYLKDIYKNPEAIAKADMEKILGKAASYDSITKARFETISERTRLLYVGITRAREYLYMSGYYKYKGKFNEEAPSAYLKALMNDE